MTPADQPCGLPGTGGRHGVRVLVRHDVQDPHVARDELAFHMDIAFRDAEAAEQRLVEMGATRPAHQPGGGLWSVLLCRFGQPFCISGAR
ncbi:VOC family protein [Streptomyces sp. TLI_146]|uniref:VOC family protein n=1 Tax=Streptomyces sp. TLI_146 TaxID=1938858 RepID=UPI00214B5BEA|nr:VOC family protein [Streptomyces sp. TLI_146]